MKTQNLMRMVVVGAFVGIALSANAQRTPELAMNDLSEQGPSIAAESYLLGTVMPGTLTGSDFEAMSRKERKAFCKAQVEALTTRDKAVWEPALRNIIFLSTIYGDEANFKGASGKLLDWYMFDSNEQIRIMALAGMHAIGHHDTMAELAQRMRLERSERVRRLTELAVVDYFAGPRTGEVTVGAPELANR